MENKKQTAILGEVKYGFLGTKYLYIDKNTRIRYGVSFSHLGKTYTLERKNIFWIETAWTYPSSHIRDRLCDIIEYLKWYEENKRQSRNECLF